MKVSTPKFILTLAVGLTAILGIMMAAFATPAVKSGIHNVPIGIVTTNDQAYQKLAQPLQDKDFDVTQYQSTSEMKKAVNHREVYGAFALSDQGDMTLYKATAASSAVSQVLEQVGQTVVANQKQAAKAQIQPMLEKASDVQTMKVLNQKLAMIDKKSLKTIELKSFPSADPKGTGLAAGALPIALGGWIGSVAIANIVKGKRQKFWAAITFAIIGGLGLIAVVQFGVGTFDGNYFLSSSGAMLGIAATAFFVLGLLEIMGNRGLIIAAITLILLGNPLSGLASAPEMLPSGWGAFGQLLPPGATGTLLRNLTFFDGNATLVPFLTLVAYIVFGLTLFAIGKKSVLIEDVKD
ncbi:ABC transporter permease [Fructobacillus sp. M2-14]|uniref:ABC transporter permease n=1 Tax=Fructobacillus broussonetiae TaxID=2713173 RepID=A0ABS5QZA4_9LACO|nr:ABC transporter permease [Fructobacillus broussonetiae]MBS9338524.1 ABC transporter permease [Fructobacillus broussonetiae]